MPRHAGPSSWERCRITSGTPVPDVPATFRLARGNLFVNLRNMVRVLPRNAGNGQTDHGNVPSIWPARLASDKAEGLQRVGRHREGPNASRRALAHSIDGLSEDIPVSGAILPLG